mgnify:CR=1 FL=1
MFSAIRIAAACCLAVIAGCASLPDTQFLNARYEAQAAKFESARGSLSPQRSAAIIAELKRKSGDLDILDKQVALEQEINVITLVVGTRLAVLVACTEHTTTMSRASVSVKYK